MGENLLTMQPLPDNVCNYIVQCFLQDSVAPQLSKHFCHHTLPCVKLKETVQLYIPLGLVCKKWQDYVANELGNKQLYRPVYPGKPSLTVWGHRLQDIGPYYQTQILQRESQKVVCVATDYSGPEGCFNTERKVVIKFNDNHRREWVNETTFLQWCSEEKRFAVVPKLIWTGNVDTCNNAIVMERMGKDLQHLWDNKGLFTPRLTLAVAIQTLQIYKRFHENGWLHLNAKPGNFVIGPNVPGKNTSIFAIDFEYSRPVPPRFRNSVHKEGWNIVFRPLTWEMNGAPCMRDDLEGLGYVFAFLQRGLPWGSNDDCTELKMRTKTEDLFRGMASAFIKYFNAVKILAWNECPKYEEMIDDFNQEWKAAGYDGSPGEVNWWEEFKLREERDEYPRYIYD